jgi:hypothetical protein
MDPLETVSHVTRTGDLQITQKGDMIAVPSVPHEGASMRTSMLKVASRAAILGCGKSW